MATTLTPASVINDQRTQAHLELSARLQALDLTPLLVMTLGNNLPASILPYMTWQFDMSIPAPAMQSLGATQQAILQNAIPLHQRLGTPWALKTALALCGVYVTLLEGQASWGGSSYPSSQGWAAFRVGVSGSFQAPIGLINGVNRNFTLRALPAGNSLRAFYNGLLLRPTTDYTVSSLALTTTFAPVLGSLVSSLYRSGTSTPLYFDSVVPTVSGGNLVLPQTPINLELYRNGLLQTPGLTTAQLGFVTAIANFFKPARSVLDAVTLSSSADYTIAGNVITPTVPIGTDSFLAFGTYAGAGTTPNFADYITPAGLVNGSNTVFTLPQAPNPALSLKLYTGYQLMKQGLDYTLAGSTITYTTAPPTSTVHLAFYRY